MNEFPWTFLTSKDLNWVGLRFLPDYLENVDIFRDIPEENPEKIQSWKFRKATILKSKKNEQGRFAPFFFSKDAKYYV